MRDERRVLEKRVRVLERGETVPEIGERESFMRLKKEKKIALAHEQYLVSIPSTVA